MPRRHRLALALLLCGAAPLAQASAYRSVCPADPGHAPSGELTATRVAAATVDDDRVMNSFHAYFVRPVDIGEPLRQRVGLQRDGRGFSTRTVTSSQQGREAFSALVSFAVDSDEDRYGAGSPLPLRRRAPKS